MSAIGEMRGFRRSAEAIAQRLMEPGLSAEHKAELIKQLEWFDDEARFCAASARQEAREEAAYEPDDYDTEEP